MNLRSKEIVPKEVQIQIAQSIFYILYHVEIPLIAQLGLKILKKLNISLKNGIQTPFDYEYKLFKANDNNELEMRESFRLPRNSRNNITLLCSKISNNFNSTFVKELARKFEDNKPLDAEE